MKFQCNCSKYYTVGVKFGHVHDVFQFYFFSSEDPRRQRRYTPFSLELVIIVMELLQLKVAENSYNIIPWKVREQKCFHRMFCSRKKKKSFCLPQVMLF